MLIATSIMLVSCRSSLDLKLNSARIAEVDSYGYSKDNPICISYYHMKSDSIIYTYVKRLSTYNKQFSESDKVFMAIPLDSLKECVVIKISDTVINKSLKRKRVLKECTIKSGNQLFLLYFDTKRSGKEVKIPKGLFFSRLCG